MKFCTLLLYSHTIATHTHYRYIYPLHLVHISAQSVHYSSGNEFPYYLVHYSHFYSVSCLSCSITGEVANEKFWKNHRLLPPTPTTSYPIFSSIRSLHLKKWISWLLTHYSHFYTFPVLLLEKKRTKNSRKSQSIATTTLYHIQISAQSVNNNWSTVISNYPK